MVSIAQVGMGELGSTRHLFEGRARTKVSESPCCPECLPCPPHPLLLITVVLFLKVGLKVTSCRKPFELYSTSWSSEPVLHASMRLELSSASVGGCVHIGFIAWCSGSAGGGVTPNRCVPRVPSLYPHCGPTLWGQFSPTADGNKSSER